MPDPLTIIGGVSSILQIITSVTQVAKSLNEVRESYDNVALNTTLVASQLSTIRAALEALHAWRVSDTVDTEATIQLDKDLGLSLSCCAILITVIDGKLTESGYKPGMGIKQKIRYVWLEDILKEYVSNLEGQVRALQLLLTIFQCRTATEQKQQLANQESREIIEQVRAETMTLGIGEMEMDDAMSILSHDPSVHLDVESILMRSPAYLRVYSREVINPNGRFEPNANSSSLQKQDSPRRKKLPEKPPPPPPRRKAAPRPTSQPEASSQTISVCAETEPLPPQKLVPLPPFQELGPVPPPPQVSAPPPTPQKSAPQDPTPPSEIAPQPPPVPPRPKSRAQSRPQHVGSQSREQPQSQGRINVWDFLGPGQGEEVQDSGAMVMADSAPVFELSTEAVPTWGRFRPEEAPVQLTGAAPEPYVVPQPDLVLHSGEPATMPAVMREPDLVAVKPNQDLPEQLHSLEPPTIDAPSTQQKHSATETSPKAANAESQKGGALSIEPSSSLEGFRYQLDRAFEERSPSGVREEGLGVSFTPSDLRVTPPVPDVEDAIAHQPEPTGEHETKSTSSDVHDQASKDLPRRTLSIHSSVDLYDASVKDMLIEDASYSPTSHSIADHEVAKTVLTDAVNDELEAQMEGLSILDQRLASKCSDGRSENESAPPKATVGDQSSCVLLDVSKPAADPTERLEPITTFPTDLVLSPRINTTPSHHDDGSQVALTPPQPTTELIPTSPTRAPPLPPTRTVSIPPIPYSSPTLSNPAARNSGVETSTASSGRDSSVFEASSTISSSEPSVDNTILTLQQSTSNTAATSTSIDGPGSAREQAQSDLRRLQSDLTAAKARGDSKAAQNSLQESIEVIRATYLAASAPAETKKSRSPRLGTRASLIRFPYLPGSAKASALGDAAAAGDLASVKSLLDSKVNVDARSNSFKTPLMRAAMNGHVNCLDILKQRGADEFAVDALGRTVLHLAVASNRLLAVKWLLGAYPPPRPDQLKHRGSILFKATDSIKSRSPKSLREVSDAEGSKPLHIAVDIDQGGMIKTLLPAGVDIEAKNNWNRTPLHQAIISNRRDCFDILLRNGANINVADARGMSPLHWAAKTGHVDIIGLLLGKGANRYEYDLEGSQPMHQAAWVGQVLAIETLVFERSDLDNKTKQGETLLHIACVNKNLELATYLLDNGVEVNPEAVPQPSLMNSLSKFKIIGTSMTPLHYACCKGNYEMALLLLDRNAWVNAPTPQGATALMMATESEDTNTVNLLLNRGAKVNANMSGNLTTALHIAARRGDLETVQQLCRAGASPDARNHGGSYGRTPLEEATKNCVDKVKRYAVEDYLHTIRANKRRNASVQPVNGYQPYEMVGRANSTAPADHLRAQQPVSYALWGRNPLVPHDVAPGLQTQAQSMYQRLWPATYPQLIERAQSQPEGQMMQQQWYDPNPLTHVESPPPYQPGPSVSARLANQAPVHRPGESTGPKYS